MFSKFRTQPTVVIPDAEVKRRLGRSRIFLKDGLFPVQGKIIGWRRTAAGPLGAVVVNEVTDNRFLVGVNFKNGKPKVLAPLT